MTVLRVVIDTNVLLSALLFQAGTVSWVRDAWKGEVIRPVVSLATVEELVRVLGYPKFRLSPTERDALLGDYLPWCETVTVPGDTIVPACRDRFDRPFLALALTAKADALVTGDGDLLALSSDRFEVPILTPAALRARL